MLDVHYGDWGVGNFITSRGLTFYEGCVVKYVCRHRKKDGVADLKKAISYLEQLVKEYEHDPV